MRACQLSPCLVYTGCMMKCVWDLLDGHQRPDNVTNDILLQLLLSIRSRGLDEKVLVSHALLHTIFECVLASALYQAEWRHTRHWSVGLGVCNRPIVW